MAVKLSIIGTGVIGTSLALALKEAEAPVEITGHDKRHENEKLAQRQGAFDRTHWNLHAAVEGADLVVLAIPLNEIRETLGHIGEDLRPDAVVLDTAELKTPVLAWAKEMLPDHVHFIGGNPLLTTEAHGPRAARADLFRGQSFALTPASTASPAALDLVTNLLHYLGARPLFITPEEHDSMMAAVRHLPILMAIVYGKTVMSAPSWREMSEMAGPAFATATALPSDDPQELYQLLFNNRAALAPWVRQMRQWLDLLQHWIEAEETEEAHNEQIKQLTQNVLGLRTQWEGGALGEQRQMYHESVEEARRLFSWERLLLRGRRRRK